MKKTDVLGERKIIEIIQDQLDLMPRMPVPFGDDVSAYDLGNGKLAVLKTDMLVGKTDVPKGMSLWQAARKAVVMNVSDFAAKGVKPLVLLVSLGLPAGFSKKDIEAIGDGLNAGAREYGAYIIGGDTGETSDLTVSISLFGVAKKGQLVLRMGAEPGDFVAVTGLFGKSSSGLRVMLDKANAPEDISEVLVESVLMPCARLQEGLALSKSGAVTAAIDSSDGLAWCLHEIRRVSNVGFLIERLPVAKEVKSFVRINDLDTAELVLYGGEEYELVVTVKPRLWFKAKEAVRKVGGKLTLIGKVTSKKEVLLRIGGKECVIESRGYEHFR